MSLRPLAVLSIALGTLSLVACSDTTAPTSQSQIQSTGPDGPPQGVVQPPTHGFAQAHVQGALFDAFLVALLGDFPGR